MKRPLTGQEVARQLEYHPDHLRRLLRTGKVREERIGQMWLIDRQEVERIKALQGPGGRLPKSGRKQN